MNVNEQITIGQVYVSLPGLKKTAEVALRDWRWHARKGDFSVANMTRLKDVYLEAHQAVEAADELLRNAK
jgi:hypothetical protein